MPSASRPNRGKRAPKLDVAVTTEIIAAAVPTDSGHCMIADAVKAAIPHASDVTVDLATIRYTDRHARRRYVYLTPPDAQDALLDFDNGILPAPFEVVAHAAQIRDLPPKKAKTPKAPRAKTLAISTPTAAGPPAEPLAISEAPTEAPAEPRKYQRAAVVNNPAGGGTAPIRVGGSLPRMGALPAGTGSHNALAHRTGRTRRFGLRAMGRPKRESYDDE